MVSTVKHGGGGIMVCGGCMAASGVGNIVVINGIMEHLYCIQILKENFRASAEKLGIEEDCHFYQDNDPKHFAQNTRLLMLYNCPKVIKTAAQSPELNPIEHLWSILEKKIKRAPFFEQTSNEWSKIDQKGDKKFA
ncbi:putative transposase [Trichonephila clavipes]|nr:putative transposase [Trichonephila clavipes]